MTSPSLNLGQPAEPRFSARYWVFDLLDGDLRADLLHLVVNGFLMILIVLNVTAFVLSTVEPFHAAHALFFDRFETFSVIVFTAEYLLRAWACTAAPEYRAPVSGRLRYLATPLAIIDLAAVLPYYLAFLPFDARFLRVVRVYRLFRLAKLSRYSAALRLIGRVLESKRAELAVSLLCMLFMLLVAASLVYFVEHDAQPDKFSSIPAALWWAVITLTTIGYGDVYPVTTAGRLLASGIALLGVGTIALPAGILGAAFMEEIDRSRKSPLTCPHCGKPVEQRGLLDHGPPVVHDHAPSPRAETMAAPVDGHADSHDRRRKSDFEAHGADWTK